MRRSPPRPPWVQDWDALSDDERRVFARMQEVFAGFLSHTDHHLGRLFDGIAALGQLDNTIVMLCSDNGASAEGGTIGSVNEHRFAHGHGDDFADNLAGLDDLGGFRSYNHYPWGWAWAGNTPFRLWKRYTWLGGTRTPLIVRWPQGITDPGGVRSQFCHLVDLFPTILDVCGVPAPTVVDGVEQQRIDGASLRTTFSDPDAPEIRTTQYFEMLGSRSIYHDGWKATTDHVSQGVPDEALLDGSRDLDADRWSLFRLTDDFTEAHDLADDHPDVVQELEQRWWHEAEANNVLPIDDGLRSRMAAIERPLWPTPQRMVYRPGGGPIADEAVPSLVGGRCCSPTSMCPRGAGRGCPGRPRRLDERMGARRARAGVPASSSTCRVMGSGSAAERELAAGRHTVGFRFLPDGTGGGTGVIVVDDEPWAAESPPPGHRRGAACRSAAAGSGSVTTPASRSATTTRPRSRGPACCTPSRSTRLLRHREQFRAHVEQLLRTE